MRSGGLMTVVALNLLLSNMIRIITWSGPPNFAVASRRLTRYIQPSVNNFFGGPDRAIP